MGGVTCRSARSRRARVLSGAALALALLSIAAPASAGTEEPAGDEPASEETINARLIDQRGKQDKPVEGVTVVVEQGGDEIGQAESDADGLAIIPVPGPGKYSVRVDPTTFPKGLGLTDAAQEELPNVQVFAGRPKFVIFGFGERLDTGKTGFERVLNLAASGLRVGLIVAVAAVGLSLVFGTTGLINFAHGELLTFGGVVAWYLSASDGGLGITLVVAGILAVILGAGFGAALERGVWRPLRGRRVGNISLLVVSIGLALFLRNFIQVIFGSSPRPYEQYATQDPWHIGPIDILPKNAIAIVICVVVLVTVALLLLRTRLGTALRAVTDNAELSESSGIDVQRVIMAAWISCGALAALAGVLLGVTQSVDWDMGENFLLLIFAAMIVGGLGSPFGAMVGGMVLGVAFEASTYWVPVDFKKAMYLGALIIVLLVRPQGILGVRERVG
ncbi:MAG: branched-chain amino acid ABC transporter permease [Actinobacteria bacterium]|nr:branched-chain amino acid ABC transporter permease [Actinomycetota bacterium]